MMKGFPSFIMGGFVVGSLALGVYCLNGAITGQPFPAWALWAACALFWYRLGSRLLYVMMNYDKVKAAVEAKIKVRK